MSWPPPLHNPRCPTCGGADERHKLSCPRRPGGGYQAIPVSWVVPAVMIEPTPGGLGNALEDVRAFNEKFAGRPVYEITCKRLRMISEEAVELMEELERDPQVRHKIAHEALDLVYVALGALVEAGVSAEEAEAAWAEIHRANMAKIAPEDGSKARKPEGWVAPDVEGAMAREAGRPPRSHLDGPLVPGRWEGVKEYAAATTAALRFEREDVEAALGSTRPQDIEPLTREPCAAGGAK